MEETLYQPTLMATTAATATATSPSRMSTVQNKTDVISPGTISTTNSVTAAAAGTSTSTSTSAISTMKNYIYGVGTTNTNTTNNNPNNTPNNPTNKNNNNNNNNNNNTNTNKTKNHVRAITSSTTLRPKATNQKFPTDVLNTVRDKIEAMNVFEFEQRVGVVEHWKDYEESGGGSGGGGLIAGIGGTGSTGAGGDIGADEEQTKLNKESLRRAFQQSISAAVLVSLAHKRYDKRRLAAMEIEKVVRNLVYSRDLERVRAILLLLSDDYVRSTNEDARKGGVVALAACAIGLKKAHEIKDSNTRVNECKDLILASVIHACQDHSQRVRYYATESLFNVIKVLPTLAVQHFFILFEILRSLWADVDADVRSGAELLDKKLKEIIIGSINTGQFNADSCIPLFARFVYMRNKPTKRLTLTWLQQFSEKLVGAPLLESLHLFLNDIFAMVSDPNAVIRQAALQFLNSMLPKLLMKNEDFEDAGTYNRVDFDKILQSLVTAMEHPDPFVRKVAMYWVSRIVQTHMGDENVSGSSRNDNTSTKSIVTNGNLSAASVSVRNSLPHVLPGLLLAIGDTFESNILSNSFLPDQATHYLAQQTNICLQHNVRKEGRAYMAHLDAFIVALREELDTPFSAKNRSAKERKPYRMDVKPDGTGIESTGWYRDNGDSDDEGYSETHVNIASRHCALEWIALLFEYVVPDSMKDGYAEEFITPVIRLLHDAPEIIAIKSLEILAKITMTTTSQFEKSPALSSTSTTNLLFQQVNNKDKDENGQNEGHPMTDSNASFALGILPVQEKALLSRNREVFAALIHIHSLNPSLLAGLSRIVRHMCTLQPPEFIFVSFGLELYNFVSKLMSHGNKVLHTIDPNSKKARYEEMRISKYLDFVTKFVQVLSIVLLTTKEAERVRFQLKDCIAQYKTNVINERKAQLFHILLDTFSHDAIAALSLCLWSGAYRTASCFLHKIDPLDIDLPFYLELDHLIELIERPLFRDLHLKMLECDEHPCEEGSSAMLYRVFKSMLMLLPQSTSYNVLQRRLLSVARFRQCAVSLSGMSSSVTDVKGTTTEIYYLSILKVRQLHCDAKWRSIRSESLEPASVMDYDGIDVNVGKRDWLGYADEQEEVDAKERRKAASLRSLGGVTHDEGYKGFSNTNNDDTDDDDDGDGEGENIQDGKEVEKEGEETDEAEDTKWKEYWAEATL